MTSPALRPNSRLAQLRRQRPDVVRHLQRSGNGVPAPTHPSPRDGPPLGHADGDPGLPGRVGRPSRAARAALLDAGPLQPAQRRGRGAPPPRAPGPGHRARRRRGLRHQAPDVPRGDRLLPAGDAPPPAGEVDRGPPRAHAHREPLPRALPRRRGRLRRRGRRPGAPGPHRRRLRGVLDVAADGVDGRRHGPRHPPRPVPHPPLPRRRVVGVDQQVPARRLPWGCRDRRPASRSSGRWMPSPRPWASTGPR